MATATAAPEQSIAPAALAERRLAQIFEAMPVGLVVVDGRGTIAEVNSTLAGQFGYRPSDLIGQRLELLLPERYRAGHGEHMRSYAANPVSRMMGSGRDLTGLHRKGHEFPIEIALTRIEGNAEPGYLAIVGDISGRKRAEAALKETNAQLEAFTYAASHDLRSPLRGIGDLLGWIREDLGDDTLPAEIRRNFDRAAQRIERAERMIDDLLAYARAGTRNSQVEIIDPRLLIDEVVSLVRVPQGFTVELDITGGPLTTQRVPLRSSLGNLVGNAVKHHGGESGRIRITMRDEGRFAIFTVADDGGGIAAGAEERIFRLFHRANTACEGDGVGLAITRRMINAHGGMIRLLSEHDWPGACFEVHWPRMLLKELDDA